MNGTLKWPHRRSFLFRWLELSSLKTKEDLRDIISTSVLGNKKLKWNSQSILKSKSEHNSSKANQKNDPSNQISLIEYSSRCLVKKILFA